MSEAESGVVYVCEQCQHEDELTEEETLAHNIVMIEDYATLQALGIVHGGSKGLTEFFRVGGVIHLPQDLVQKHLDEVNAGMEEE